MRTHQLLLLYSFYNTKYTLFYSLLCSHINGEYCCTEIRNLVNTARFFFVVNTLLIYGLLVGVSCLLTNICVFVKVYNFKLILYA